MKRCIVLCLSLLFLTACTPVIANVPGELEEQEETAQGQEIAQLLAQEEGDLLAQLEQAAFQPRVPASDPVAPAWFSDAAFVGDSVSVMLEYYNRAYGTLGRPAFLCAEGLSQSNALIYDTGNPRLPEWPKGSGRRPKLADGVAESGAAKIYVCLGMNCIAGGVDRACRDLLTLINGFLEKCPNAAILIQSVTPMTADSPRADASLNNETIRQYNQAVEAICKERGWYYLDLWEALADENGALRADYSGDKAMGIHLNYAGAGAWADYLLRHVPKVLL